MARYETADAENAVEITDTDFTTYTRGTPEPLYSGPNQEAARKSLEMTEQEFQELILSDPIEPA